MYVQRITILVYVGTLACWAGPAGGQVLELGRWDGALEMALDSSRVEITSAEDGNNPAEFETIRLEERVTIRNAESFLIDPRLAKFSFGATFGLSQEDYKSLVGGVPNGEERDADLSGYNFLTTILPSNAKLSAELFANRNQYVQIRELSGSTDVDVENFGAKLRAMRLYIPSWLTIRRESSAQESRNAASTARMDERRNVLRYDGSRGWINKQVKLHYEFVDKTDRVRPSLDYRNQDAGISSEVDFGPDLNRIWRSTIRANLRDGFSAQDRLQFYQTLRIQHRHNLRTSYRYRLNDIKRTGGETKSQLANFSLNHKLYESLTTNISFDATDQYFDDGQRSVLGGILAFSYTKRLPAAGRLNASFSTRRQREDDDFEEAFVPQELHIIDSAFATPVYLDNPNVVQGSVEITKTADGPPVAGCPALPAPINLVEGVDYLLRTVAGRVEIVPQPCTANSPGINPGDTIAVDYRFTRGGEPVTFNSTSNSFTASVDYDWIRPFFRLVRRDQDIVSGIDTGFLTDSRETAMGIELRGKWSRLHGNLLFEAGRTESDDLVSDDDRVTAQLRYTWTPRLSLSMNGTLASTEYSFPEVRESDLMLLRAELSYHRNGSLDSGLFATLQELEDSRLIDERKTALGIRVRWLLGKLSFNGTVSILDVDRGNRNSRDYRAMLNVKRSFYWR